MSSRHWADGSIRAAQKAAAFGALIGASAISYSPSALAQAVPNTRDANAPNVALSQFDPAPVGDRGFEVQSPGARGQALPRFMLMFDWAHHPLMLHCRGMCTIRDPNTGALRTYNDENVGSIVGDQVFLHLDASIALADRFMLSLDIPVAVIQSGDDPFDGTRTWRSPSGLGLGDFRLGARARLLGEPDTGVQFGVGARVWLPTGTGAANANYTGDDSVRGNPFLVVGGEHDTLAWSAEFGVLLREKQRIGPNNLPVGTALTFGAGVFFFLDQQKTWQLGPELYGQTVVANGGASFKDSTNAELLLGGKWRPGGGDWVLGLGAGPGLGQGAGSPMFRIVAMVAYSPETDANRKDRDSDGVPDDQDACPDDAGVKTGDPKTNGCPAPPGDRDNDGVKDEVDKCPDEWGEKDNQGCPKDTDKDGVADYEDHCPKEPGPRNDNPEYNGCPRARIVEEEEAIIITEKVQFDYGKATIKPESDGVLNDVAKVLKEHPELEEVEVQGHTDNKGSAALNRNLSDARAHAVRKWLVDHGISGKRLKARGYGPDKPIADNDSDSGREKNRRVEFKITKGPGQSK